MMMEVWIDTALQQQFVLCTVCIVEKKGIFLTELL